MNKYGYVRVSSKNQNEDRQMSLPKIFLWINSPVKILTDPIIRNWLEN